ncbi:Histone H2B [Aphelenchoides bicaudatus]|nr:Histone H2B [Aphelenchoides bicaudatus]
MSDISNKNVLSASGAGAKKRRRKARNYDSYATYIHRVLKQVNPEAAITKKAMMIMDSAINDLYKRLCTEAAELTAHVKKNTLQTGDMRSAVKLVLPAELGKHADTEGTKALAQYKEAK